MHQKLAVIRLAAWAFCMGPALAQKDGYCYDAEQHPLKFSDLGSRLDITQALHETCETPVGDQMYTCNAAVSAQTLEDESALKQASHLPQDLRCPGRYYLLSLLTQTTLF